MANLYDKASLVLPTSPAYKDGAIQAYKPLTSQGTFDFSRGSNLAATRVDANGLIEKGRENLMRYSNDFANAAWSAAPYVTSTGGQQGYDGTNNASELEVVISGNYRSITQASNTSGVITNSIYAKAGNSNYLGIVDSAGQGSSLCIFDLTDGSVTYKIGGDWIETSSESVGNGWYRLKTTHKGLSPNYMLWFVANASNSTAGDAGNSVFIQDAQQEVGLAATDYIETGASTAQAGILEDMPRLDYSDGDCPSLLLEPQRTNTLANSEYFLGSGYTSIDYVSITLSNETSPEGKQNAFNFIPTTDGASNHRMYTLTGAYASATQSIFIKPNGHYHYALRESSTTGASIGFNLEDENIIVEYSTGGCTASNGKIEPLENGWYRISGTFSFASAANNGFGLYAASPTWSSGDVESVNWAGDGVSGAYIYGAQLESGSYPTSYIPTYGSSVTRSGDSCSKTGVANVIGQTEGTMFIDFIWDGVSNIVADNVIMSLGPQYYGTSTITISNYNGALYARVTSGVTIIQNLNASIILTSGTRYKIGFAYANNDFAFYVNGNLVNSASSGTPPATSSVYLNNYHPNTKNVNQSIVFPTRLSNAELAALTTIN
jgi:hypothetical protein